ncbi:MAG: hypothetical protein BA861_02385 [Desulfobacterales bacterium S3730MH5]|nr:MAG: hypothetical protein BA861_02385 [Desulfobacterales bacterium S3730MH5]
MGPILINPSLKEHELSRLFGGGGHQSFSCSLSAKVESYKEKLNTLLEPRLHYRIEEIADVGVGSVSIEGGTTFRSPKLSRALRNSNEIVCFVATVGGAIEDEIDGLMAEKRLSEAYILDAMGSVAVENMVEQFHQGERSEFTIENRSTTLRFSPGYCDWPVTEQKKLFGLFASEFTGIDLLDSCLMQPRKSISGLFGLSYAEDHHPPPPYNPCQDCKKTDCMARRT